MSGSNSPTTRYDILHWNQHNRHLHCNLQCWLYLSRGYCGKPDSDSLDNDQYKYQSGQILSKAKINLQKVLRLSKFQKVTCQEGLRWTHQSYKNSRGDFGACAEVQTPESRVLEAELFLDVDYCRTEQEKTAVVSAFETYIKSAEAAVPCISGAKCTVRTLISNFLQLQLLASHSRFME